jgi:hypothetical protein
MARACDLSGSRFLRLVVPLGETVVAMVEEVGMPKFSLVELPPELRLQRSPIVRAERDAVYIGLRVFSEKDPDDFADFQLRLAKETAQHLAADLIEAIHKVPRGN